MAKQNKKVVFRRIGGRIVPIQVAEGASDIALGAAIALGGGVAAGLTLKAPGYANKLAKAYWKSKGGAGMAGTTARKVFRNTQNIKSLGKSAVLFAAPIFVGGMAFGSAYVSRGIQRARNERQASLGTLLAQNAGDVGAFGLAGFGFLRGAGYNKARAVRGMGSLIPDYLQRYKPQAWADFSSIVNRMRGF